MAFLTKNQDNALVDYCISDVKDIALEPDRTVYVKSIPINFQTSSSAAISIAVGIFAFL